MQSGVYLIENNVTKRVYVGSAANFATRWAAHRNALQRGAHHSIKLQRAWDKHSEAALVFRPVLVCSKENLLMYEQIVLDWYQAAKRGYNILPTAGSRLGTQLTADHKQKIGAGLRNSGRVWAHSPEARAKIGAASKGRTPSAEARQRQREALLGRRHTPEAIENMRLAQSNRTPLSDEARQRMSEAAKRRHRREIEAGKQRQFSASFIEQQGKPKGQVTDETRRRLSEAARRRTDRARNEQGRYVRRTD